MVQREQYVIKIEHKGPEGVLTDACAWALLLRDLDVEKSPFSYSDKCVEKSAYSEATIPTAFGKVGGLYLTAQPSRDSLYS